MQSLTRPLCQQLPAVANHPQGPAPAPPSSSQFRIKISITKKKMKKPCPAETNVGRGVWAVLEAAIAITPLTHIHQHTHACFSMCCSLPSFASISKRTQWPALRNALAYSLGCTLLAAAVVSPRLLFNL